MCSLLSRVLDGGARAPSPKPCSSARVRRAATRSRDDWPLVSEVGARASASHSGVHIVESSTGRRSSSPVAHNPVRRRESARPRLAPAMLRTVSEVGARASASRSAYDFISGWRRSSSPAVRTLSRYSNRPHEASGWLSKNSKKHLRGSWAA